MRTEQEVKDMLKTVSKHMKDYENRNEGETDEELDPIYETLRWVLGYDSSIEGYFPV